MKKFVLALMVAAMALPVAYGQRGSSSSSSFGGGRSSSSSSFGGGSSSSSGRSSFGGGSSSSSFGGGRSSSSSPSSSFGRSSSSSSGFGSGRQQAAPSNTSSFGKGSGSTFGSGRTQSTPSGQGGMTGGSQGRPMGGGVNRTVKTPASVSTTYTSDRRFRVGTVPNVSYSSTASYGGRTIYVFPGGGYSYYPGGAVMGYYSAPLYNDMPMGGGYGGGSGMNFLSTVVGLIVVAGVVVVFVRATKGSI